MPQDPVIVQTSRGSTLTRVAAPPAPPRGNPITANFRPYIVEHEISFNRPDELVKAATPPHGNGNRTSFWVRASTTFDQNGSPQVRPRENVEYHPALPAPAMPALLCLTEAVQANSIQSFWETFKTSDAILENAIDQSFDDSFRAGAALFSLGAMEVAGSGLSWQAAAWGLSGCFWWAAIPVAVVQGVRYGLKQSQSFAHQRNYDDCAIDIARIFLSLGDHLSRDEFQQQRDAVNLRLAALTAIDANAPESHVPTRRRAGICHRALEELNRAAQAFYPANCAETEIS